MARIKPRVKVPKKVAANEIVTIKTLINHKMESGQRKDKKTGEKIPRKIINAFNASFNGETVFAVDLEPAVSANPYLQFRVKVAQSGEFHFSWNDDDGTVYEARRSIEVS